MATVQVAAVGRSEDAAARRAVAATGAVGVEGGEGVGVATVAAVMEVVAAAGATEVEPARVKVVKEDVLV